METSTQTDLQPQPKRWLQILIGVLYLLAAIPTGILGMLSPMASDAGVNFWIYLFIFSLILLPFSFFISGILMLMGKHTAWARMAPWIVIVLVALGALGWELT